jgi:hypothetical protein
MFLESLASAIATAEGFYSDDRSVIPVRLNNPGDLMFAGQANAQPHNITGGDGKVRTFAEFTILPQGVVALYRQILARVAQGYSLRKLICDPQTGWAPASDGNDSNNYLKETLRRLSVAGYTIDPDAPLWDYVSEIHYIP